MPIDYPPIINEKGCRTDRKGREICGKAMKGRPDLYCSRGGHTLDLTTRRCKDHTIKKRMGITHPAFTDGHTSLAFNPYLKNLPDRMLEGVKRNLNDPKRLELNYELAVMRERAADLMRRAESGESGHLWKRLREVFIALKIAQGNGDEGAEVSATQTLDELITRGTSDYQAWEEIGKQTVMINKIVETELKREQQAYSVAPVDQIKMVIQGLAMAVRECVEDAQIRDAVQRKFNAILEAKLGSRERNTLVVLDRDGEVESVEVAGGDL